jgi:6-phosphogluconate dehydrogenase
MEIGLVGPGRMGGDTARRLIEAGHEVVAVDIDEKNVAAAEEIGSWAP